MHACMLARTHARMCCGIQFKIHRLSCLWVCYKIKWLASMFVPSLRGPACLLSRGPWGLTSLHTLLVDFMPAAGLERPSKGLLASEVRRRAGEVDNSKENGRRETARAAV